MATNIEEFPLSIHLWSSRKWAVISDNISVEDNLKYILNIHPKNLLEREKIARKQTGALLGVENTKWVNYFLFVLEYEQNSFKNEQTLILPSIILDFVMPLWYFSKQTLPLICTKKAYDIMLLFLYTKSTGVLLLLSVYPQPHGYWPYFLRPKRAWSK